MSSTDKAFKFVRDLTTQKRLIDALIVLRYFYRIGQPLLSDQKYNSLEESIQKYYPDDEVFKRTYDEDPLPFKLLSEGGLDSFIISNFFTVDSEIRTKLEDDKSTSIKPVKSDLDVWSFVQANAGRDFILMPKVDGVFTRTYCDSRPLLSLSRGRKGECLDYTENILKVLPSTIDSKWGSFIVKGEASVDYSALTLLRGKYPSKDYVTPKSSAISMLLTQHEYEDYKYLRVRMFDADGLSDTVSGTLDTLKQIGFETVPYNIVPFEKIPKDFQQFKKWFTEVMDEFYQSIKHLYTDGAVFEINDKTVAYDIKNQYMSKNIAIKYGNWEASITKSKIKRVLLEQKQVHASVRLEIEPVITPDFSEARILNIFNLDMAQQSGYFPGEYAYFKREGGSSNNAVTGEELNKIRNGV